MNGIASDNVQLFRKIIDRGFCQGDLSVADEICATTLSEHEYLAKNNVPGPEILKDQIRDARSSIRDLVLTVEDIVESGETVWARSRATGSDPRSGKPVAIYVVDICRFETVSWLSTGAYQTALLSYIKLGRFHLSLRRLASLCSHAPHRR